MPAHSAHPSAIDLPGLRACTDTSGIFELFRKLHYPVAQPVALPLEAYEASESLRKAVKAHYFVAEVGGKRPGDPRLTVRLFVLEDKAPRSAVIRELSQTWTRSMIGDHLLVFAAGDQARQGIFEQITFVNPRRVTALDPAQQYEDKALRVKLHKLIVDRRNPRRHDVETLNRIALPPSGIAVDQLSALHREAFNVERVTNEFYKEYARRFKAALARIRDSNRGIAAFYDETRLHTFTQRLFGRLMFLYFLQKKGALNGDPNFITSQYQACKPDEGENFYRLVLEPLFFETLNQPRPNHQSRFGRVPYLNGGLFAPDEEDQVGLVLLDNDLFDPGQPEGLLHFLNGHNFTIEEDTPLEVQVALDPEMLGKVFENLLEVEERGQSGTFYTPRQVVAFMCREALAAYLTRETGLEGERLGWLLDEAETGEPVAGDNGQPRLTTHTLPRPLRDRLENALKQVRVLDPAVGSGAFPLGMLALLVGVRRALYRVADVAVGPQSHLVEGWKRDFIRDCLYGVDIKREAIEVARLRLWLSLVVDADPFDMEPLPNLDFKLMAGDSLIETFQGVTIYPTRRLVQTGDLALEEKTSRQLIERLRDLKDEFFQPIGARSARELRDEIFQTERAIVAEALKEREQRNQERFDHLSKSLINTLPSPTSRAEIEALSRDIEATRQTQADLKAGKTLPFFLYRLHFGNVFEDKDGFDIVIANPPYVRHEKVPASTLKTLRATYPAVEHGSADLYVYFYARGLELLREGGTLAFISSNKFFRAGYGKGLRDLLTRQTQAQIVLDFADAPIFDATAYPCIVLVNKGRPAASHTYRGLTADTHIDPEKLNMIFEGTAQPLLQVQGVQPPASSSDASELVRKLMQMGKPLKDYQKGKVYRGIVTGLNPAFVVDQATHDRLIAEHQSSAEVLKPFLRGRDLGRYVIQPKGLWLIFTRRGIDITHYPAIERYLSQFREDLQPRQLGQNGRGRKPGPYKWYEIQDSIDYHAVFEAPKIAYPELAPQAEFSFDISGSYPDSTAYCIAIDAKYLTAMFNSHLLDFVLMHLSPSMRGGFYRYKREYLWEVPIVEPPPADQTRLAALVDQLQALFGQGPEAEALEREIDEIVYRTYGLSTEEVAEIERWHAQRRAQLGAGRREQPEVEEE